MDKNQGQNNKGWLDQVAVFLMLLVGYPIAAVILLFSPRSSLGFMGDLKGAHGREVALEWGESILVAFLLALLIRSYLFQPFKIPSGSMRMTLIEGDRLFVNKLAYGPSLLPVELRGASSVQPFRGPAEDVRVQESAGDVSRDSKGHSWWDQALHFRIPGFAKPKRGDVIVFRYPVTRDKDFIKRLIAFGGETVEIKGGRIYINDQPIVEGSIARIHYYNRGEYGAEGQKIQVPEGHFFVLGDNSGSSHDSRYWGFVPEHFLIGRADVIFWPLDRIRWIK